MHKSDLLALFFTLSDSELREAKQFLRSPYFNKREDVVTLFDFLLSQKDKPKPDFSRQRAYKAVAKSAYDDAKMRHLMSYLLQLLVHFLHLQHWEQEQLKENFNLYNTLKNRNLEKKSKQIFSESAKQIESEPLRDKHYHFQRYQWFSAQFDEALKKRRTGDLNLEMMSDEFTKYYLSEALRQACALLSYQNMTAQQFDLSFAEDLILLVERKQYQAIPAIAVYYHSFFSLQQPDESSHFFALKTLLSEQWQAFPQAEIRDIYRIAINYCIKKQNKGEIAFIREGFELYKMGIENEILLENGELSVFTYNNVHLLADKLGEFDWIIRFLERYKSLLPVAQREHHYQFNLAQFYFRRKQYAQAMPLLQTLEFVDTLHNLDARKMLLVMYYDLGEFKALDALIDSFSAYLQRQKEINYHKESFSNLIKFTKKLLIINTLSKLEKQQLEVEIQNCAILAEKAWLLGKL
jgi:hypothetical protein